MNKKIFLQLINDINLQNLSNDCAIINEKINKTLVDKPQSYRVDDNTPFSTSVGGSYNILCHPSIELNQLYNCIRNFFFSICENKEKKYYIQSWVNFYTNGQYLNWHRHWGGNDSYHGFFCVNSNISSTTYKFNDGEEHDIESKNGLLVLTKSSNNLHRTSACENGSPRITIAFDIHPHNEVKNVSSTDFLLNKTIKNWIPL